MKFEISKSIVRRSILFCFFLVPAYAANFLLQIFCLRFMVSEEFGVFYVANTLSNVLFAGSAVTNLLFTKKLVQQELEKGSLYRVLVFLKIREKVISFGILITILLYLLGLIFALVLGVNSKILLALIVIDVLTCYIGDLGRVYLQVVQKTILLGFYTFVWMWLRLFLAILGYCLFENIGGLFVGIVVSAIVMILLMDFYVKKDNSVKEELSIKIFSKDDIFSFLSYSLFVGLANLDILSAYFILTKPDLTVYAASSILPKAILVILAPVQQMLFPTFLISYKLENSNKILIRNVLALMVIGMIGVASVSILNQFLCGNLKSISMCNVTLSDKMLFTIIPLTLIRLIVVYQLNSKKFDSLLILCSTSLMYFYLINASAKNLDGQINNFTIVCCGCLFVMLLNLLKTSLQKQGY